MQIFGVLIVILGLNDQVLDQHFSFDHYHNFTSCKAHVSFLEKDVNKMLTKDGRDLIAKATCIAVPAHEYRHYGNEGI